MYLVVMVVVEQAQLDRIPQVVLSILEVMVAQENNGLMELLTQAAAPDPVMKAAMLRVSSPTASTRQIEAAAALLSREPLHNAVLRTGQSLTLMNGGIRSNVIPSEGTATFNVRVLPNDDVRAVVSAMNRICRFLVAAGPPK